MGSLSKQVLRKPTISWLFQLAVAVIAFSLLAFSFSQAQSLPDLPGEAVSITTSARFPEPNQLVTLTLNDYTINSIGSTINWRVDGVDRPGDNNRSIEVEAGPLGTETKVDLTLTQADGSRLTTSHIIKPVRLDIIVEGDTLTPPFYRGRALPSKQSNIKAVALLHTASADDFSGYTYRWLVNNNVAAGGGRVGQNTFSFVSDFDNNPRLTVEVYDRAGEMVASRGIRIKMTEPELHFYEVNPLRGQSRHALSNTFFMVGNETTVRAEPYFVNRNIFTRNTLLNEWRLNRSLVSGNPSMPNEITLARQGDSGSFRLDFQLRNTANLHGVRGNLNISF